jgi:tetratricopeptide (TPR) repeat protein
MEKVFLRVYNREIEGMIEGGQLDEAVAHCQHILKTFPMHVETYRLLGKTFLEARRYADAADIFERVLMAVPDDFVSHVGMSIIRDDEGNLDDAIWHMERAFEVQPSNSAIQGELRRLYGRRDGMEPSKIRLSRDALANMYSQGELFNQAIAEIRSVLAEDPVRPDLQVMLMRAYYRSGQKVEAAEIATTLLKKYPYCLDSLRVLVDVLPGTARAENTQVYRHRLFLLDPYSSFAQESAFSTDQVADSAVNLERLDYRPGLMPGSPRPDWASSLGIKGKPEKQPEPPPAWMQTPAVSEKPAEGAPEPPGLEAIPAVTDAAATIPDWMRSGGWHDSGDEEKDGSADSGQASSDEPIAKADIPDWLMSMAPAEINKTEENQPEEPGISEPVSADGIPEWLKPMTPKDATGSMQPESEASINSIPGSGDEPVALVEGAGEKSMEPAGSVESQPEGGEDLPDWLKSMIPGDSVTETIQEPQQPVESHPASDDDVPDWLKSITPVVDSGEQLIKPQEPVVQQPSSSEDVPDFLKSMASAEVAGTSNVVSEPIHNEIPSVETGTGQPSTETPTSGTETIPDWLADMGDREIQSVPSTSDIQDQTAISSKTISEQTVPIESDSQAPVNPLSPEPGTSEVSIQPPEDIGPLKTGEDALGWLEQLNDKQDAKPEEQGSFPQNLSFETPDWLHEPGKEHDETPITPPQVQEVIHPPETLPLEPLDRFAVPSESTPDEAVEEAFHSDEEIKPSEPSSEAVVQSTVQQASFEEDTMAWLERLSIVQEKTSEKPLAPVVESLESSPVQNQEELDQEPTIRPPEETVPVSQEPAEDQDITITSWLNKVDVQKELGKDSTGQPPEEKPGIPVEELPDWLKDLESPATPVITPKVDDDLPEWLRHPISPAEPESASEPETPTWVDENMQITGQATPTMPDEWLPAEVKSDTGAEPVTIPESTPVKENPPESELGPVDETVPVAESEPEVKPKPVSEPVLYSVHSLIHPPTLKQTGMLSPVPVQDKDAELLSNAQTILDQDSLDESMKQYSKLIKKGRLLDEVIHDLREGIYRYPVDVIIWQTLGDAYMRTNHLQDALDAYTKAEELLR